MTNMFEEDEGTLSLKNNSGVVKDFKVSTKDSHILIEVQYEWEPDINNIGVLYRNAQKTDDINKDINQKLETVIKATVERVFSGEKSVEWVTKADVALNEAKKGILEAIRIKETEEGSNKTEEDVLGIKLMTVRLGNIDLSEAESKSRVSSAVMDILKKRAKNLVLNSKVDGKPTLPFDEAMKLVLANEGKAKISSQKLNITAPEGCHIMLNQPS